MKSKGFTLIEVMAALALLAISLVIVSSNLIKNLKSNYGMQIRYEAMQAAQKVIDDLRFQDISTLSTEPMTETVTIGNRSYEVNITFCETTDYCVTGDMVEITARVNYNNKQYYETDTVFSTFK
ncbi:MAG: prepilin-type N-terminal cleavage/methylation domain-containing protein [Candidatus Dadabacteria bacterium]|nr:MAG: prepilin-type N-terminal cleavage/methylation domain-containing protein [Candidatus Dadabacteria bacterium]